jgi:hypothetical protein
VVDEDDSGAGLAGQHAGEGSHEGGDLVVVGGPGAEDAEGVGDAVDDDEGEGCSQYGEQLFTLVAELAGVVVGSEVGQVFAELVDVAAHLEQSADDSVCVGFEVDVED